MARFITLCSSSSGNAAFIGTGNYGVLVDAGVSAKRLKDGMSAAGLDPAFIRALFVTHEHADHIAGVRVLASQLKIPVYATRGTLAGMQNQNVLDGRFQAFPMPAEGNSCARRNSFERIKIWQDNWFFGNTKTAFILIIKRSIKAFVMIKQSKD